VGEGVPGSGGTLGGSTSVGRFTGQFRLFAFVCSLFQESFKFGPRMVDHIRGEALSQPLSLGGQVLDPKRQQRRILFQPAQCSLDACDSPIVDKRRQAATPERF
jgi:hypothetical protein